MEREVIRNFYPDLEEAVKKAEQELETVKIEDEVTDVICEECGQEHGDQVRTSQRKFLACPGFPECRNTKPYLEKIGVPLSSVRKKTWLSARQRKGANTTGVRIIRNANSCHGRSRRRRSARECGGYMVEKGNKLVCADEKCGYVTTVDSNAKKELEFTLLFSELYDNIDLSI